MNCIIIDDEEMARAIITQDGRCMSELKLVQEFPNAIQAIKFFKSLDLIFLDIHMPDFTGFDFIQSLKNPPLVTSDKICYRSLNTSV
jgi:YesN/AraC family two-component response regulator